MHLGAPLGDQRFASKQVLSHGRYGRFVSQGRGKRSELIGAHHR